MSPHTVMNYGRDLELLVTHCQARRLDDWDALDARFEWVRAMHGVVQDPIHHAEGDVWELFDLKKDPRELRNLYGQPAYADATARLKTELRRLQKQYGDV